MFIKRLNVKPMIVCPIGAILPANITIPVITEGTFLEKVHANMEHKIAIVILTTEELIALVEKPHLFGIDVIALVGVPGGRYDAIWSTYVAPLRRISLETLDAEVKTIEAAADAPPEPRPRSIVDRFARAPSQEVVEIRPSNDDDDEAKTGVME